MDGRSLTARSSEELAKGAKLDAMRERGLRPGRGRPVRKPISARRGAAPTRTRLLALRVLERVQRAGAYADVLLHSSLARSGLSAPDRAFPTALAYLLTFWALARVESSVVAFFIYLQPLIATSLSVALFGDRLTPALVGGAALIFLAVYLTLRSPR